MIPLAAFFWYALNRLNVLPLAELLPVKVVWSSLAALFRVHGCIKAVALANEVCVYMCMC